MRTSHLATMMLQSSLVTHFQSMCYRDPFNQPLPLSYAIGIGFSIVLFQGYRIPHSRSPLGGAPSFKQVHAGWFQVC